jgi:hypothetical protein
MYDKQKQNATCRKHKRAKRVMTPRNRMRKRKHKRITSYSVKPSKINLSYSRKKHRKLRTKTIKRFRKRTPLLQGGDKLNGFSEETLAKGVIAFAKNTTDVQPILKDVSTNPKFKDVESLPLLMSVYSVIIKHENITEKTKVLGDTPENTITNEGIHLTISKKITKYPIKYC